MSLLRAAFVLFIAIDLIILLLAIALVSPYWALLFLIISALARGWYRQLRIRQDLSHLYTLKKRNYVSYTYNNK